ncbi:MAG: heavy metal transport/detoxification protein [Arcobacter sp.]|uniref:cation transporter n=1 Tax=uncultured Arcobacter sp. TaxID=165434 RepID=UPI000CAF2394|nr:cation transporter [uncultured Arcobacter sp.]PLY10836.1 MAG: heavy metal transport/detoxification protein [Arcobacter sp.]
MKKIYKANNINCESCKNLIKASLEDEFGTIEVDLTKTPKEITLEINSNEEENKLKEEMKDLGFDILD